MGGGLELALACHHRLADADAAIAMPEVRLGLIPGAGGTQRLPRAVGLKCAIEMIITGEIIQARDLAQTALFDEIVSTELRAAAITFAKRITRMKAPLKRLRDFALPVDDADQIIVESRARLLGSSVHSPAPMRGLEAAAAALVMPFDEGVRIEREHFEWLMDTAQSRALRHIFFAERALKTVPGIPPDTLPRNIERVGVIGAGTMGSGIAMTFLNARLPVCLVESSAEFLSRGVATIRKHYDRSVERGSLTREASEARMQLLRPTLHYADLGGCDLIVEAVFESMEVKQKVFTQLDSIAKPGAILASNTSSLDLDLIADSTRRAQDVIGLHFFSPAHVMRLMEIVRGRKTANDALVTCLKLARRIKKVAVVAGVCDGFIGNRMLHAYQAVAEDLLVKGASPLQVDQALETFGMAMGPFRVGDLAGLDIGWAIRKHRARLNPAGAPLRIADRLCEAGRFGQKAGAGWYRYEKGSRDPIPEPFTAEAIEAFRNERGVTAGRVGDDEIVAKCIYILVNEGARILEEGIALRASDIDMVWLNGYGFPRHRGGPMHFANELGLRHVLHSLARFSAEAPHDARWSAAPLLVELGLQDKTFS
jgi:3-hydroxyacyl-CoA dehydrogenase